MARSLQVKHEEKAATSSLLNGFILVALAWLIGSALFSAPAESATTLPAAAPAAAPLR